MSRSRSLISAAVVALVVAEGACLGADDTPDTRPRPAPRPEPEHPGTLETMPHCASDPELADPGLAAWTAHGGAVLASEAGRASALFSSAAVCSADARMQTPVTTPNCFAPLAVRVKKRLLADDGDHAVDATAVSLGAPLDFLFDGHEATRCLGERSFGGDHELAVLPRQAFSSCEGAMALVEDVAIVRDDRCPAPGTIAPFSAWTVRESGGTAQLVGGAFELTTTGSCDDAVAEGPNVGAVSFPDLAGVGIRVHVESDTDFPVGPRGLDGLFARIGDDRVRIRLHVGDNTLCVPRELRGTVQRLAFDLSAGDGACAEPLAMRAAIDPPTLVADACPDVDIVDADLTSHTTWNTLNLWAGSGASFTDDAAVLEVDDACDELSLSTAIGLPEQGLGPGVIITYRLEGEAAFAAIPEAGVYTVLAPTGTGTGEARVCLPRGYAGSVVQLELRAFGEGGTCALPSSAPVLLTVEGVEVAPNGCVVTDEQPRDGLVDAHDWELTGGALVATFEDKETVAVFPSAPLCAGGARLTKTLTMPASFERRAFTFDANLADPGGGLRNDTAVLVGGRPLDLLYPEGGGARCLGAAAFGGASTLDVRVRAAYGACEDAVAEVGGLAVIPWDACPAPGEVSPFSAYELGPNGAALVGDALDLVVAGTCDSAGARSPSVGAVSFPDESGAALAIEVDGDSEFGDDVRASDGLWVTIGRVRARLTGGANLVCVPSALRGASAALTFELASAGSDTCDPQPKHALIHPPTVVTGACAGGDIVDPEIEGGPSWRVGNNWRNVRAALIDGAAVLEVTRACDELFAATDITVPGDGSELAGPAVRVRYQLADGVRASVEVSPAASAELPSTGGAWAEATLCLPRTHAGELRELTLRASGEGAACAEPAVNAGALTVDAVQVELDASCP